MSQVTDFFGKFHVSTSTPDATMAELGQAAAAGHTFVSNSVAQTAPNGVGGALMINVGGAFYGVALTTSTSTTTTTTSTSTTTTSTTTTTT